MLQYTQCGTMYWIESLIVKSYSLLKPAEVHKHHIQWGSSSGPQSHPQNDHSMHSSVLGLDPADKKRMPERKALI